MHQHCAQRSNIKIKTNVIQLRSLPKISELTATVIVTPKISMTTWIVVLECAGSIPKYFMKNGNKAPIQILMKTIVQREAVIASVSGKGTPKNKARPSPEAARIKLKHIAIFSSVIRNLRLEWSCNVPSANSRITDEIAEKRQYKL